MGRFTTVTVYVEGSQPQLDGSAFRNEIRQLMIRHGVKPTIIAVDESEA